MKKALTLLLSLVVAGMATAASVPTNGTSVGAAIIPQGNFPSHAAYYGHGGWRSVATTNDLSLIDSTRMETGMAAYVTSASKLYVYDGANWTEFVMGGGVPNLQMVTAVGNSTSNGVVVINAAGQTSFVATAVSGLANGNNMVAGAGAGASLTSGINNTIVGKGAGANLASGNFNTVVGNESLYRASASSINTAIGDWAMHELTNGNYNTAIGAGAMKNVPIGADNHVIGPNIMADGINVNGNIGMGYIPIRNLRYGDHNIAFGSEALRWVYSNAYDNVSIGRFSLWNLGQTDFTNCSRNVALGPYAGYNLTGGSGNIFLGYYALASGTSVSNEFVAGGVQQPIRNVYFGSGPGGTVPWTLHGEYASGLFLSLAEGGTALSNKYARTGTDNTYAGGTIQNFALATVTNNASTSTDVVNWRTMTNYVAGVTPAVPNLQGVTTVGNLTSNGMIVVTAGGKTSLVVNAASSTWAPAQGGVPEPRPTSTLIGYNVGGSMTSAVNNTLIGYEAGRDMQGGEHNVMVGDRAGVFSTNADENVFVGQSAGYVNKDGWYNVYVGREAGENNSGSNNTTVGHHAGRNGVYPSANPAYHNMTILGDSAGETTPGLRDNILMGVLAQASGASATNEFVAGSATYPMRDVYFGGGPADLTIPWTLHGNAVSLGRTDWTTGTEAWGGFSDINFGDSRGARTNSGTGSENHGANSVNSRQTVLQPGGENHGYVSGGDQYNNGRGCYNFGVVSGAGIQFIDYVSGSANFGFLRAGEYQTNAANGALNFGANLINTHDFSMVFGNGQISWETNSVSARKYFENGVSLDAKYATISTTNEPLFTSWRNATHIALGNGATTNSGQLSPILIGNGAWAFSMSSYPISIGRGATNTSNRGVAIGNLAVASNDDVVAVGNTAVASGNSSQAIGDHTIASGSAALALGSYARSSGGYALGIGAGTIASGDNSVALGHNAASTSNSVVAVGYGAGVGGAGDYSIVIGFQAAAPGLTNTVQIGQGSAVSNGWFHYQAKPILNGAGALYGMMNMGSGAVVPTGSNTVDLGSALLPYKDLYAAGTIREGGTALSSKYTTYSAATNIVNSYVVGSGYMYMTENVGTSILYHVTLSGTHTNKLGEWYTSP